MLGKVRRGKSEKDKEKEEVSTGSHFLFLLPGFHFVRSLVARCVMTVADCSTCELPQRIEGVTQIPQQ